MQTTLAAFCFLAGITLAGCLNPPTDSGQPTDNEVVPIEAYTKGKGYEKYGVATFAGGCFWCTEASFERINGVVDVVSGYAGGDEDFPTYEDVGSGKTGHTESIQIYYDSLLIDYPKLLEVFFVAHDPTQLNRQGPDVGKQYRSAIFYHDTNQKEAVATYIQSQTSSGRFDKPIVTEVVPFENFWVAEEYHQDYYEHNPNNPYVQQVSKPKVEKVMKTFEAILKDEFKN